MWVDRWRMDGAAAYRHRAPASPGAAGRAVAVLSACDSWLLTAPEVHRAGTRLPFRLARKLDVAEPGDVEDAFQLQPPLDPRLRMPASSSSSLPLLTRAGPAPLTAAIGAVTLSGAPARSGAGLDALDAALGELRAAGWPAPEGPDPGEDTGLDTTERPVAVAG